MTADTRTFILGIHHFCDHRCWRCDMTSQCAVAARLEESGELQKVPPDAPASRVAAAVAASLHVTMEEMTTMVTAMGLELPVQLPGAGPPQSVGDIRRQSARAEQDPLVVRGGDYASTSWRVLKALRPRLAARGDGAVVAAAERLEETCMTIASKIFRAVSSSLDGDPDGHDDSDVQSDANGSAKVARLLIEEARRDWSVLMQDGRAVANGVPSRLVQVLDSIERDLSARLPRALEFVRPGFDTPGGEDHHRVAQAILRAGSLDRGTLS